MADGKPVSSPRYAAPGTGSSKLDWRVSKGLGTVHATTVVYTKDKPRTTGALIAVDGGSA